MAAVAAAGVLSAACAGQPADDGTTFSEDELTILSSADSLGVLRVLTIYDQADSLVLRDTSVNFSDADLQSESYAQLAEYLVATVQSPDQGGVGIAAPQIGINRRVAAVQRFDKEGEPFEVYANLHIIEFNGEKQAGREGCLSIPGWRGNVDRYQDIVVAYTDPETLTEVNDTVQGYTAVIFQHETDHLDGILYIDRTDDVWKVEE
ncbi:MAG: peptide deformylase [Bacteroidales bacterium]|nr:peptide deformylase [Bacteroidales bacterium]